jgi:Holliday junction DNA helicase RuvA
MIAMLRGRLFSVKGPTVVFEVHGVGYAVQCSERTIATLRQADSESILHTHQQIREDAHVLFGFASEAERDLFRILIDIQGVGGSIALNLMSALDSSQLKTAIAAGDLTALCVAKGVGKKLAERIILDLKNKLTDLPEVNAINHKTVEEAAKVLMAMGYTKQEATAASRAALDTLPPDTPSNVVARTALASFAPPA